MLSAVIDAAVSNKPIAKSGRKLGVSSWMMMTTLATSGFADGGWRMKEDLSEILFFSLLM